MQRSSGPVESEPSAVNLAAPTTPLTPNLSQAAEAYFDRAEEFATRREYQQAADCYRQALALRENWSKALVQLGIVQQQQGQLIDAAASYQQAIANPDTPASDRLQAYNNLGCILALRKQFEEALAAYQAAGEIDPNFAPLYNNLGQMWLLKGEVDRAIAAYRRTLELSPGKVLTHYNLGKALQRQHKHEAALACFEDVLRLDPNHGLALSRCCALALEQRKWDAAIGYLRQEIDRYPHWIEGFCDRFADFQPADDFDRALQATAQFIRSLQQTSEIDRVSPHLAQAYLYWGHVQRISDNPYQAGEYYQKVLDLRPDDRQLYQQMGECLSEQQRVRGLMRGKRPIAPATQQVPQGVYLATRDWCRETEVHSSGFISVDALPVEEEADSFTAPNLTYPACEGINCGTCLNRIEEQWGLTNLGQGIYAAKHTQTQIVDPPETFAVWLPEGRTWTMPQESWWRVCEAIATITPDNYLLADLSREYPGQLPGCERHEPTRHRLFRLDRLPEPERIDGAVAVLTGLSANVYFHWMVDVLPRVDILRQAGINLDEIDYFLVNQCWTPFQRETLQQLGIPLDRLIESDRHPHIQARQLIVPSFPGYLGWIDPRALAFLRQEFLPKAARTTTAASPEYIYISRGKAKYRCLLNEAEIVELLEQVGFVVVALEELPLWEQVALFAGAKAIVAPHGSGFTNTLFCPPRTIVIELISPNYQRHYFGAIAQALDLQHYYVTGETFHSTTLRQLMYPNPLTEDIFINVEILRKILRQVGILDRGSIATSANVTQQNIGRVMPTTIELEQAAAKYQKQAEELCDRSELDKALSACQNALKLHPEFAPTYKTIGNIARARGQIDEAQSWYRKALKFDPNYAEAYANLGSLAANQSQWKEALAYYQKAIALKPDFTGVYRHMAKVWQKLGKEAEAADCLYRLYELEPQGIKPEEHLNLGNTLLAQGQLTQAIACYQQAVQLNPNLFGAYPNLAEALRRQGRFQEATQYYRQAIQLGLTNASAGQFLNSESASKRLPPAIGDLPEASRQMLSVAFATYEFMNQVVENQQEVSVAYEKLDEALKRQASLQAEAIRYRAAMKQILVSHLGQSQSAPSSGGRVQGTPSAEQLPPSNGVPAATSMGSLFDMTWSPAEPIESSVSIQPVDVTPSSSISHLNGVANRASAGEAIAPESNSAERIAQLIEVADRFASEHRGSEAIAVYRRVLALDPQQVNAHVGLGDVAVAQSQPQEAIRCYQAAVNLAQGSWEVYHKLGDVLLEQGQVDEAIAAYRRATELADAK
jgi:tetratricopeptide (TPR) repeat protein